MIIERCCQNMLPTQGYWSSYKERIKHEKKTLQKIDNLLLTVLIITITFKKFSSQILTPSSSKTNVIVSTTYAKFWTSYNFNSSIIHPHSSSHYDIITSMLQSVENISIILVSALPFMWFQTLRHHVENWNLQLNIKIKKITLILK